MGQLLLTIKSLAIMVYLPSNFQGVLKFYRGNFHCLQLVFLGFLLCVFLEACVVLVFLVPMAFIRPLFRVTIHCYF